MCCRPVCSHLREFRMEVLKVVKAFPVSGELEIGLKIKLSEIETFKIAIEKVKNRIGHSTW